MLLQKLRQPLLTSVLVVSSRRLQIHVMRFAKPAFGSRARTPKLAVVAQIAVNVPTVRFVRAIDRTSLVLEHEQFAISELGTVKVLAILPRLALIAEVVAITEVSAFDLGQVRETLPCPTVRFWEFGIKTLVVGI